jgi:phytoene dehydrogenase-like protein
VIPCPPDANLELLGPAFDCLWRVSDEEDAVRVIRAARAYQEGLWIAGSDPSEAWVRLVGAIEVAASKMVLPDPWETLTDTWPEMAAALRRVPEEQALPLVRKLARERRAQKRFIDFLVHFDPGPPDDRPAFKAGQVDWGAMRSHLRTIYDYRSRALHDGRPFP